MAGTPLREVEEVLDRHARRLAGELGRLLVDVGRTLQNEAKAAERPAPKARAAAKPRTSASESSREDLYREASKLGVKGRSRMSKDELREAIARARRVRRG
jgi:hypothetical protein